MLSWTPLTNMFWDGWEYGGSWIGTTTWGTHRYGLCQCTFIYIYIIIIIIIIIIIKSRLKLGNACYYPEENLLSSRLLSKNLKIEIYRTIILPVVLYGCETWSLTLREERRLRVFENRVLSRVFGPKTDEVTGNGENYTMRSLGICTPYPILCGW